MFLFCGLVTSCSSMDSGRTEDAQYTFRNGRRLQGGHWNSSPLWTAPIEMIDIWRKVMDCLWWMWITHQAVARHWWKTDVIDISSSKVTSCIIKTSVDALPYSSLSVNIWATEKPLDDTFDRFIQALWLLLKHKKSVPAAFTRIQNQNAFSSLQLVVHWRGQPWDHAHRHTLASITSAHNLYSSISFASSSQHFLKQ